VVSEAGRVRPHLITRPGRRWWLVVLWLVVLALMSTQIFTFWRTWEFVGYLLHLIFPGGIKPSTQALIHLIIRKTAHFGAYTVFFLVLIGGPLRRRPGWALLICLALASLDETHQLFVPGRTASLYDVAVDFSGAIFGRFFYLGMTGT
jgi:VanZ family protein